MNVSHEQKHPIILTDVIESLTREGGQDPEDLRARHWLPGHLFARLFMTNTVVQ